MEGWAGGLVVGVADGDGVVVVDGVGDGVGAELHAVDCSTVVVEIGWLYVL